MSLAADLDIPESGAVFTFGKSHFADNEPSHFFIKNDPVTSITCGDDHTAVICYNGRVFVFGTNNHGQLGLGHTDNVERPACVKWLKPRKAKRVACGRSHTLFLTENDQLYGSGDNSEGQLGTGNQEQQLVPQYIELEKENEGVMIKQIDAGSEHSIVLTDDGCVYGSGSNNDGQLGLGAETKNSLTFKRIPIQKKIQSIACGYYFTFLVTVDGEAYSFGNNESQRLGTSNPSNIIFSPEPVSAGSNISNVSCGQSHTFLITTDKKVLALGSNAEGQLGLPRGVIDVTHPTEISSDVLFNNVKISVISCGAAHTGFVTEEGAVYTCGNSSHQKLCLDNIENDISNNNLDSIQYLPDRVNLMKCFKVSQIACGGCHTVLLATKEPSKNTETSESLSIMELPPLQKVPSSILNQNGNLTTDQDNVSELSSISAQARLNESLSKVILDPMSTSNNLDSHSVTSLDPNVRDSHILEINDLPDLSKSTEKIISLVDDKLMVQEVQQRVEGFIETTKKEISDSVETVKENISTGVETAKDEMDKMVSKASMVKENLLKVPEGIQHSPDMSTKSEVSQKSIKSVTDSQKSENETIVCNSNKNSPQLNKTKTQAVIPIKRADEVMSELIQDETDVIATKVTDTLGQERRFSKFFSGLKNETCMGKSKVISSAEDMKEEIKGGDGDSSVEMTDQTNSRACIIL